MRRCGTCWVVLREAEDVDQHAKTSRLHAEAVQALEARRAESLRAVRASIKGT